MRYFAGLGFQLRWHFLSLGRFVPYLEGGASVGGTNLRVREIDSDLAFLLTFGAGASVFITDNVALYAGYRVPPHYDSLIAKLVVHGATRNECLMRLRRALEEFVVEGIETTRTGIEACASSFCASRRSAVSPADGVRSSRARRASGTDHSAFCINLLGGGRCPSRSSC